MSVDSWLLSLVDSGPPEPHRMLELVEDYEFRYWLEPPGVIVHLLVVEYERLIIIKSIS